MSDLFEVFSSISMWTVECVANNAPGGRPAKRPALCLLPSSEVAAEAARFQVEQLRKQWPVSEVEIQGDGERFSCGIFVSDGSGNSGSYQVLVRECDQTFDSCQISQLEGLLSVPKPCKRNKSMMLAPPCPSRPSPSVSSSGSGSLSDPDVVDSAGSGSSDHDEPSRPQEQRTKRLRSAVSEIWCSVQDPFTDRQSGDSLPYRISGDLEGLTLGRVSSEL